LFLKFIFAKPFFKESFIYNINYKIIGEKVTHKKSLKAFERREILDDTGPHVVNAQVVVESIRSNPDENKAKSILGSEYKKHLTVHDPQRTRKS